ncbi:hypothetical protein ACN4BN_07015 [Corynebacterium macclintockiae]|uniref:hypothetical protein n=1 Tax=Corynebacterium macclintockiae TaxID=2913501 RepID=UPI003EC05AC4
MASHVKNAGLQKQIDALTPPDQKGKLGEYLARERFKDQLKRDTIRGKNYPSFTESAEYRVPDVTLKNNDIVESKFMKNIAAGDRPWEGAGMDLQIKDGIEYTRSTRSNYHLVVPPNATISPEIQSMFDAADHAHIVQLSKAKINNTLASKAYL